jgi:hypothetical protein
MDEIALIRALAPSEGEPKASARDATRQALQARMNPTSGSSRSIWARSPRRGLIALTGVGMIAVLVVGILILSSGPRAEPAAAEVLHETAAIAASGEGPAALEAGPGQYYFTNRKEVEFMGWYPGSYSIVGGPATRPGGFSALIPKETDYWLAPEGGFRSRETLGTPRFLSSAEQARWEEAGSPLPRGFDPRYEPSLEEAGGTVLKHSRGVFETEQPRPQSSPENFPDLSRAPTDPTELRLAIRNGQAPGISEPWGTPVGVDMTGEILTGILARPNASPALRAAAFNALAELPGFELDRDATDLAGRPGYAISYDKGHGERGEFIFDPTTSMLLGEREVLVDPGEEPQWKGYEAGLTLRDVAYLQSKVVDSTREPAE